MRKTFHVRKSKNLLVVESMIVRSGTSNLFSATPILLDYIQYYLMLLEQCHAILAKQLVTATRSDVNPNRVCLLTWLDCFFVVFSRSNFNSITFRGSISCIVNNNELTKKKHSKLDKILSKNFRNTIFVLQKTTNPQNKQSGVQEISADVCVTDFFRITESSQTFLKTKSFDII